MAKKTQRTGRKSGDTEGKIKRAALKLFTKKGFAATRTRDISREAGINLALLNYYFRSKEKLFELVMTEILFAFFSDVVVIFNDQDTSVEEKISAFVSSYTVLLKKQPDLPFFVFHEVRLHPEKLASGIGVRGIFDSYFFRQLESARGKRGKSGKIHPVHDVINMISLSVFPFIAAPMIKHIAGMSAVDFSAFVDERKELIPLWMRAILEGK